MEKLTSTFDHFVSLLKSLETPLVISVLNVVWKIVASVRSFSRTDVTPRSFECLERRLEGLFRERDHWAIHLLRAALGFYRLLVISDGVLFS